MKLSLKWFEGLGVAVVTAVLFQVVLIVANTSAHPVTSLKDWLIGAALSVLNVAGTAALVYWKASQLPTPPVQTITPVAPDIAPPTVAPTVPDA